MTAIAFGSRNVRHDARQLPNILGILSSTDRHTPQTLHLWPFMPKACFLAFETDFFGVLHLRWDRNLGFFLLFSSRAVAIWQTQQPGLSGSHRALAMRELVRVLVRVLVLELVLVRVRAQVRHQVRPQQSGGRSVRICAAMTGMGGPSSLEFAEFTSRWPQSYNAAHNLVFITSRHFLAMRRHHCRD